MHLMDGLVRAVTDKTKVNGKLRAGKGERMKSPECQSDQDTFDRALHNLCGQLSILCADFYY